MKIIGSLLLLLATINLCMGDFTARLNFTRGGDRVSVTFDPNQESDYTTVLPTGGSMFTVEMPNYSHIGRAFIVSLDALDAKNSKPIDQNLVMYYESSGMMPTKSGVRISICGPNRRIFRFGLGLDQDINTNLVKMSIKPDPTRSCQYYSLPKYSYVNYISSDSTLLKPTLFIVVLLSAFFFLF
ncbi:hypothetical protein CYY_008647 [Polysphondylium violaceum]|uniref:Uncharacterized protein n=1 Tax=Polysphondylium violaceum TaxID=133409 RepID=A0A8J4PMT5_9MYCE|nr:hypothetical protein CYY_008647 [Polysphondylium violaceum]